MIADSAMSGLDPAWAWAPYRPDARCPWNLRRAAHLYRRAAFGASWGQLQQALKDGPARAGDRLIRPEADVTAFLETFDHYEDEAIDPGSDSADTFREWWLRRMIQTPHPLLEKMTLFWHGHFAARSFPVKNGRLMARYVRSLRTHALGRFQPLLAAVVADPAVRLSYNTAANRRGMPDISLARSLLEQFTLGPGVATERDVSETARALSGLTVLRNQSRLLARNHDGGTKTILGETGNWTEADVVRLASKHSATARHLARLLYRWFISEADEPTDALLAPLATSFSRDGDPGKLVETVLRSNLFFSDAALGRRIKSPLEFALGMIVGLEGLVSTSRLAADLDGLGQDLAEPPTSAGWQGGTAWINPSTVVGRANLAASLLSSGGPYGAGLDPRKVAKAHGFGSADKAARWLIDLLIQGDVPASVQRLLVESARQGQSETLRRLTHTIVTLPEYQLA
ncbi:MAG: DUF1800 domain-containing protein [Isosphaeraceae bacterium]